MATCYYRQSITFIIRPPCSVHSLYTIRYKYICTLLSIKKPTYMRDLVRKVVSTYTHVVILQKGRICFAILDNTEKLNNNNNNNKM